MMHTMITGIKNSLRHGPENGAVEALNRAATFNGIVCTAASPGIQNGYNVTIFSKTAVNAAVYQFHLNNSAVENSTLQVEISYQCTAITGVAFVTIGVVTTKDATGIYGGETDTIYLQINIPAGTVANQMLKHTVNFGSIFGTSFPTPNRPVAVVLLRQGTNGSDTMAGNLGIMSVRFNYLVNKTGAKE